jgi:hypothetical protein
VGFEELKNNKKGSLLIALISALLWYLSQVFISTGTDFAFSTKRVEQVNVLLIMLFTLGLLLTVIIANWCFCTLLEGKGKMVDIVVVFCYSLIPYMIISFLYSVLSWYMVLTEVAFLQYLMTLGYIWSGVLLFSGLMAIHQYTISKTLASLFLTVLGTLIILFLCILIFSLAQQIIGFSISLYNEILFRLSEKG